MIKDNKKALLTIACISYNHGDFIRQTLEGFINQKVNFLFEVIVHDDASTDNTQEVIKEFASKYPEIIKPILRKENLYSLGMTKVFYHGIIKNSTAKYIATCEGDDYWIDENKLQKQVDFLEQNPTYNLSVGRVNILNQNTGEIRIKQEPKFWKKEQLTLRDFLKYYFSQTSTFVFRNNYKLDAWDNYFPGEDISLVTMTTQDGLIKYHKDVFSVYRVHSGGMTQSGINRKLFYASRLYHLSCLKQHCGGKYPLVFQSLRWKAFLSYKVNTVKNIFIRKAYLILHRTNEKFRHII